MKDSRKIKYGFLVFLMSFSLTLFGQDVESLKYIKARKLKKLAENAEAIGDVYTAAIYYEAYCLKRPDDFMMLTKLGDNQRLSRDYKKAAETYKKAFEGDNSQTLALFYYGYMMMMMEDYATALESFNNFKKVHRGRFQPKWQKNLIKSCELAIAKADEDVSQNAEVYYLGDEVNSANIDFAPFFLSDSAIVFGSLREEEVVSYSTDYEEKTIPLRKFYHASRIDDSTWLYAGEWNNLFNDEAAHTGNGAFNADMNYFYFSKCFPDWDNKVRCEIYVSKKMDGKWSEPRKLNNEINFPDYSSSMPAIGKEKKRNRDVIYWVTDRPRGRGGKDIWFSIFDHRDSTYSKPRNCGTRINSEGNDITPYYDLSRRQLYFSSDQGIGYGGYDIYRAVGEGSKFRKPINVGRPINSSFDDLYFVKNPENKLEGLFVSNRSGTREYAHPHCCDDIFGFNLKNVIELVLTGVILEGERKPDSLFFESNAIVSILQDTVQNENIMMIDSSITDFFEHAATSKFDSLTPLLGSMVEVFMVDDETDELIYISSDTVNDEGRFYIDLEPGEEYKVTFKKDEYFYKHLEISTEKYIKSDTIHTEAITLEFIPRKPIKFNIYYEFDRAEMTEDSKHLIDSTLLNVLLQTPDLIVEISSHTDSIGDSIYNKDLSQRRAESVVNYLIEKGISKRRLIAIGYGEIDPIADNGTIEGMAQNRRTEFRVIGSIDQFSRLNVTSLKVTKRNEEGRRQLEEKMMFGP